MKMKCAVLKPLPGESYHYASNATMDMINNLPFMQYDPKTNEQLGEITCGRLKMANYTHVMLYYRSNQYITLSI